MSDREVIENYQGNITIDGLVAWWKLDEGTGDVAMDSIGGHDAIIHGAKWIYFEEYAYSELGEYKVTLTIWNTDGLSDSASKYLVVSP